MSVEGGMSAGDRGPGGGVTTVVEVTGGVIVSNSDYCRKLCDMGMIHK